MLHITHAVSNTTNSQPLEFLWLELTNQCNLKCTHCYAESGAGTSVEQILKRADYENIIREGYSLGCRQIQFIGGEPQLNKDLKYLMQTADALGFDSIEVFTNLTFLPSNMLDAIIEYKAKVATSFYSYDHATHDAITQVQGSFARTSENIRILVASGVELRVGIISMEKNKDDLSRTALYLEGLGVTNIGTDRVRQIGRGNESDSCSMGELCGECAGNTLCVGPDGKVSPCIMSKAWSVGSVKELSMADISSSLTLTGVRNRIKQEVAAVRQNFDHPDVCTPKTCSPYDSCSPKWGPGPCAPNGCIPCYPKG